MPPETETIRVNFARPIPLFPLDSVVLLPHAVTRLFIFEPRYRQMVGDVLDAAGQIAMAVIEDNQTSHNPALKPAVCVGQLAHHIQNDDGTYNIVLAGVCRAEIVEDQPPEGERLYRQAILRPLRTEDEPNEEELTSVRSMLLRAITDERFGKLAGLRDQLEEIEQIPTAALLELVAMSAVSIASDRRFAYRMLREPSIFERASMIEREMEALDRIFGDALRQRDPDAPRGITWN
ncbi:MAG: LON peptidase substrate-binding domain-containing protein [Planctomycetota bacterium]